MAKKRTYYVDHSVDSKAMMDGTAGHPFKTMQAALNTVRGARHKYPTLEWLKRNWRQDTLKTKWLNWWRGYCWGREEIK